MENLQELVQQYGDIYDKVWDNKGHTYYDHIRCYGEYVDVHWHWFGPYGAEEEGWWCLSLDDLLNPEKAEESIKREKQQKKDYEKKRQDEEDAKWKQQRIEMAKKLLEEEGYTITKKENETLKCQKNKD